MYILRNRNSPPAAIAPCGHRPLLAIARCEGSACGVVDWILIPLHSGDALTVVRWRPAFRWLLLFSFMLTTDSFTLPAGRSLRSLSPSARSTSRSASPGALPGPTGYHHNDCLSPGEEEPGPEGAERGGYLPIPRRDARVGERESPDDTEGARRVAG